MRLTLKNFVRSLRDDGVRKTLTHGYLFAEALLLYALTKTPLVSFTGHTVSFNEIQPVHDTALILGSGFSINDLSDDEWARINDHTDTVAFNYFSRGEFVPINYHIVREATEGWNLYQRHSDIEAYFDLIHENPMYESTTYFVLRDDQATDSIWGTFYIDCLSDESVCFYQNDRNADLPGEYLDEIAHGAATLFDAINLCYLLGYETIVLAGVDLYDRRYFWMEDEDPQLTTDENTHKTANPVLDAMPAWRDYLSEHGISLYVENDRSLLHKEGVLPVYDISSRLPPTSEFE